MAKKNPVAIETTGFFCGTPERISPPGDKPRIRGAQQKTCLTAGFFVVRPSGFPLSGINLESAAHSKKTCLTAGFFVVRPSGFEPLAYRVGVCHSIQLSYGRIFSRSYYSKVRPKSKADFLFPFGGGYAILRKSNLYRKDTPSMKHTHLHTRLLALLLCCALVLPLSACGEAKSTTQQIFAMDTVMDLTAYGKKADDGINAAISIINSMDTLLDPENERSKTYEINHAMGSPVVVNEQIAKMLRTALTVYERTNGAFDLTTYPLSKLWGFIDQNYRVPSDAEIERLLPCVDMSKVQLATTDDSANSLVTMPADMALSFGAVAKGCASDYAIQAMRAAGVTSGVVSLGGNVQTLGKKPDGSDWNIAIQDPNDTGSYLGYLTVGETAVITSGSYQRYFTEGGQKYHHILSPATGRPVNNGLLAVTIVCEDGTLADCLSTAMFVLGPQAALNYWRTYGGFEMLLVKADGHVVLTNGLYGQFTPNGDSYVVDYAS